MSHAQDTQVRRIFLKKDAEQIRNLQVNAKEFKTHYPRHADWLDFALKEVVSGKRYAFGIYRTFFAASGDTAVDLIGSIILKREIYSNSFELKNLFVAPDFRGKKYGTALFDVVEQFCIKRGGIQISTDVPVAESRTVNFLSKRGFYVQGQSESIFQDGDRIYRMVKNLPRKYTGDQFDLLSISTWTLENIYGFKIDKKTDSKFNFRVQLENGLNEIDSMQVKGSGFVFDNSIALTDTEVKKIIKNFDTLLQCIVTRTATEAAKKICETQKIFLIEFDKIKQHIKPYFSNELQNFSKEDIRGMIVPINFKYYSSVKNNPHVWTYFKGGPTGKFLKKDDYVLMCFEESPDYVNGGVKAFAKIDICNVGSPDKIWSTSENPIFPEKEFMTWCADKAEIIAFKIKELTFIKTIKVRTITKQQEVTPYDNEKLGQFYLNNKDIENFLTIREVLAPGEYDYSLIPKIFLSSTINDLIPERSEIGELITGDLGYNVFISEYAGSFAPPRDYILSEIRDSDIYLCIFGETYGNEIEIDGHILSATQDEFRAAKNMGKTILLYVKNVTKRDVKLTNFLKEIGDYIDGQKWQAFNTLSELRSAVKSDLAKLARKTK